MTALFDNLKSFYMKQKIKEALQQKYKNLGLNEEVFERVAASAETFVTEETLGNFVDGVGTLELLKNYQSFADKARGFDSQEKKRADDLAQKLADAEAKLKDTGKDGEGKQQPDNIAELIQKAVTAAVQPLQAELAAFKGENAAKQALKDAKDKFFANDYAKKYTQERDDAWERAIELNEATGSKMSADELGEKALGYFSKSVARKGVDTTKPFEAQTDQAETFEKGYFKNLYEKSGRIQKEENV
jgi:hypothetical protein